MRTALNMNGLSEKKGRAGRLLKWTSPGRLRVDMLEFLCQMCTFQEEQKGLYDL